MALKNTNRRLVLQPVAAEEPGAQVHELQLFLVWDHVS